MLMIKKTILLAVIPALLVSCGRPSAEDATGTNEGKLAKEVGLFVTFGENGGI